MSKPNPNWLTQKQFKMMVNEFASGSSFLTAAKIYRKTRGSAEALEIAEYAYNLSHFSKELRELYTQLLLENDRSEEVIKLLDEMILEGDVPQGIYDTHKAAYVKANGSEDGYEEYIDRLKGTYRAKLLTR